MWRLILTLVGLALGYFLAAYAFAGACLVGGINSADGAFAVGIISWFFAGPVGAVIGGILGFLWGNRRDNKRQIRDWDEIARLDDETSE